MQADTISSERGRASATMLSGPTPRAIRQMGEAVGALVELAIGEAMCPRRRGRSPRGSLATCASNSSGRVAAGTGWAVSFHSTQDLPALGRHRAGRSRRSAATGSAATASSRRAKPSAMTLDARPVEQVGRELDAAGQAFARCHRVCAARQRLKERSNLAVPVAIGCGVTVRPGRRSSRWRVVLKCQR